MDTEQKRILTNTPTLTCEAVNEYLRQKSYFDTKVSLIGDIVYKNDDMYEYLVNVAQQPEHITEFFKKYYSEKYPGVKLDGYNNCLAIKGDMMGLRLI
jgi:phosphoglycolate phosphatase-like HAD superfamily hydrolase